MNLFRSLWFTLKGKDGYGGGRGYLQIKIFYLLSTKKQGKWQEHLEKTGKTGINWSVATLYMWKKVHRVATAQGKQGIWFLLFPDRENTGNFVITQGKFLRHRENIFDCIH